MKNHQLLNEWYITCYIIWDGIRDKILGYLSLVFEVQVFLILKSLSLCFELVISKLNLVRFYYLKSLKMSVKESNLIIK